jgi:hypothetical protein
VLVFAIAILAALGSFWAIVWFIRSYVEPPRVMLPAPMILAARESTPVPPPARAPDPKAEEPVRTGSVTGTVTAQAPPAAAPAPALPAPAAPARREAAEPSASVADRWAPITQTGAPVVFAPAPVAPAVPAPPASPAPAAADEPPPSASAPAALATGAAEIEEVAEGSVPAIEGPAPLPRRKPSQTAAVKRSNDPPLPRPRPDGPAPQSVWTAVPTTDDRFPSQ